MAKKILSGVKHCFFFPWTKDSTGLDKVDLTKANRIELKHLIADSINLTQDDATSETIDGETTDAPLKEVVKLGAFTFEGISANIDHDILEKCLGYEKAGDYVYAPKAYEERYATIVVAFDDEMLVIPQLQLKSKIDASSLKTATVKGNISGTSINANVTVGEGTKETPFFGFDIKTPINYATWTPEFTITPVEKEEN